MGYNSSRLSLNIGDCRFGRWLSGPGHRKYADHPAYPEIEHIHQQIHDMAISLVKAKETQERFDAEEGLFRLKQLRDGLLDKLDSIGNTE
jgi:hypothetical protein